MFLTYKYRLLPTKRQHAALSRILEEQRQLYNGALEERIGFYRKTGQKLSGNSQEKSLTAWRHSDPDAMNNPYSLQVWTLRRVENAFRAFFKRLSAKKGKAGYPRFRGASRWEAFGFHQFSGIRFDGKRLRWRGMPGALRAHLHRPLPTPLDIRACVFVKESKGWSICFQVQVEAVAPRQIKTAIGIDLGLSVFAYGSDGSAIPTPKFARNAEQEIRRRQRSLARCKIGSKRKEKVRRLLAQQSKRVSNRRRTWLHQRSAEMVRTFDLIAAEQLTISNLIRNPKVARSIGDASWATFLTMLAYKAERAGGQFITVDPKHTSQRCSGCGNLVPKSLAVRTHCCPSCGLVIDRDWNAALNILDQAVAGLGQHNVAHLSERAARNICQ